MRSLKILAICTLFTAISGCSLINSDGSTNPRTCTLLESRLASRIAQYEAACANTTNPNDDKCLIRDGLLALIDLCWINAGEEPVPSTTTTTLVP